MTTSSLLFSYTFYTSKGIGVAVKDCGRRTMVDM
jgi:hypothetical protein